MTVRLVSLGGTDWANGEIAYAADFNDTINRARSSIGSAIGTYTSGATVYTGSSSNYNRITMADTILFSGGATVGISGVAMFIARNSITINGQIIGTAFGGPGGAGGGSAAGYIADHFRHGDRPHSAGNGHRCRLGPDRLHCRRPGGRRKVFCLVEKACSACRI